MMEGWGVVKKKKVGGRKTFKWTWVTWKWMCHRLHCWSCIEYYESKTWFIEMNDRCSSFRRLDWGMSFWMCESSDALIWICYGWQSSLYQLVCSYRCCHPESVRRIHLNVSMRVNLVAFVLALLTFLSQDLVLPVFVKWLWFLSPEDQCTLKARKYRCLR